MYSIVGTSQMVPADRNVVRQRSPVAMDPTLRGPWWLRGSPSRERPKGHHDQKNDQAHIIPCSSPSPEPRSRAHQLPIPFVGLGRKCSAPSRRFLRTVRVGRIRMERLSDARQLRVPRPGRARGQRRCLRDPCVIRNTMTVPAAIHIMRQPPTPISTTPIGYMEILQRSVR